MAGQSPIRTREEFEERVQACRGKLSLQARDACEQIARTLESRARVAQRISGGTPRLWAASVADIREHAVYLMPRGFLLNVPCDKLRRYPRYVEGMRQRLFALREEGSGVEKTALQQFAPHWKRFTAWVAARMSAQRAASDTPAAAARPGSRSKAPLPQARRSAPAVNLDAGEWAMRPGALPPSIESYRWALEELRLSLFVPELAARPSMTSADLEALWKKTAADST